jgi:hypothetical protein
VSLFRRCRGRRGDVHRNHNGVLHGPAGDVPPTGRPVSIDYVNVLRFKDGKHVSFSLTFDRLAMLKQLGLISAPAPGGSRAERRLILTSIGRVVAAVPVAAIGLWLRTGRLRSARS